MREFSRVLAEHQEYLNCFTGSIVQVQTLPMNLE